MTFSDALQSAETLCEVLLIWIKVGLDYLYALAQSGPSAQIFSTGRKLDTTPKAFLSMDSHSTEACSEHHNCLVPKSIVFT